MLNIVLRYAAPVLLGAVIGAFTNKLALVMLFRPYSAKKIGKLTLPFTPGLIPKNRKRIAEAIARNISTQLITADAVKEEMKASSVSNTLKEGVRSAVFNGNAKISDILASKDTDVLSCRISNLLSSYIVGEISNLDLNSTFDKLVKSFLSKMPLLGMMFSSGTAGISTQLADMAREYISSDGQKAIEKIVKAKVDELFSSNISEVLDKLALGDEFIDSVSSSLSALLSSSFLSMDLDKHIYSITYTQIEKMDVRDIEKIIKDIAKKELSALVVLGGFLGALIGAANIFIK